MTVGMIALHRHPMAKESLSKMCSVCDKLVFIFDVHGGDEALFSYAGQRLEMKAFDRWSSKEGWDPVSWRNRILKLVNKVAEPGEICLFWDEDEIPSQDFYFDLADFERSKKPTLVMRASAPMPTQEGAILFGGKPYPQQWHMKAFRWREGLDYGPPYPGFAFLPGYWKQPRFYARSSFDHYAFFDPETRIEKMAQLIGRGYPAEWFEMPRLESRIDLLNHLSITQNVVDYVEIGVREKRTFRAIDAPFKWGVDPKYSSEYMMTSDEYFASKPRAADMTFIDGDHREATVYRDIANAWDQTRQGGCVVLHDMLPRSLQAQDDGAFDDARCAPPPGMPWNGGGWKAAARFILESPTLYVMRTLDADHGVGVMFRAGEMDAGEDWISTPADRLQKELSYEDDFDSIARDILGRTGSEGMVRFIARHRRTIPTQCAGRG